MTPTYFLDTNIFLRFIHKSDAKNYDECKGILESLKSGVFSAVTSSHVLAEITWTMKSYYHDDKADIVRFLEAIKQFNNLTISDDARVDRALKYFKTYNIKFIDCLIASSKHLQNGAWKLFSYDQVFNKIKGFTRLDPGQIT
jgi:predicted nucleic acid-binding protein